MNDDWNPRFYRGTGTPGYFAPEQQDQINRYDLTIVDDFQLTEKTNMYGMGLVLRCLVTGRTPPEPAWVGDPEEDESLAIKDPNNEWSRDIKGLIELCLNYYPRRRPGFDEMLELVEAMSGRVDPSHGMMWGEPDETMRGHDGPRFGEDSYKIRSARTAPLLG